MMFSRRAHWRVWQKMKRVAMRLGYADAEILREMQTHMCSILRILCYLAPEVLDRHSLAETQSHRYRVVRRR